MSEPDPIRDLFNRELELSERDLRTSHDVVERYLKQIAHERERQSELNEYIVSLRRARERVRDE